MIQSRALPLHSGDHAAASLPRLGEKGLMARMVMPGHCLGRMDFMLHRVGLFEGEDGKVHECKE